MCAAASSGDKQRLEWVIGLPNGTRSEYIETRPLSRVMCRCRAVGVQEWFETGKFRVCIFLSVHKKVVVVQTPLLIACSKGHKDCAALLLENGADLNATTKKGDETLTCLNLAEKSGHNETIKFIKKCHGKFLQNLIAV